MLDQKCSYCHDRKRVVPQHITNEVLVPCPVCRLDDFIMKMGLEGTIQTGTLVA